MLSLSWIREKIFCISYYFFFFVFVSLTQQVSLHFRYVFCDQDIPVYHTFMKLRQSQKEKEKTIKIVWFKEPFTLSGKTRVKFGNLSCHNSLRFFCYQVKFKLAVADFISSIYCSLLFRNKIILSENN